MPRLAVPLILVAAFFSLGFRGCFETDAGGGCQTASSCSACTAMSTCGWCAGTSTCAAGTATGPSAGSCTGRWAWTTDMCVAPPAVDAAVSIDATVPGVDSGAPQPIDGGAAPDSSAAPDSGPPPGPCPGGCATGTHCDTVSGSCVADAGGCSFVHCPDTYTWTWTGGSPVTRAGCCRDYGSLTAGVGCGVDRFAIGNCDEAGGESPVDQPVVESPNFIHCNLPTGVMDCPALYIGSGSGSSVYVEGCCAETSASGSTFCGVVGNCGSGPCCGPPVGTQTPVR